MSVPHAAGALVGTVDDLARWSNALHHQRVVGPALYAAMTAPAALPEGRTHPYGFGLGLDEVRGRATIGHSGGIFGFSTHSTYVPSDDLFVAILTNSESPPAPRLWSRRGWPRSRSAILTPNSRARRSIRSRCTLFGIYRSAMPAAPGASSRVRAALHDARRRRRPGGCSAPGGGRPLLLRPDSLTWFRIEAPPRRRPCHGDAPERQCRSGARGADRRRPAGGAAGAGRPGDPALLCRPLSNARAGGRDRDGRKWRADHPAHRPAGDTVAPDQRHRVRRPGRQCADRLPSGERRGGPLRHPPGRPRARGAPACRAEPGRCRPGAVRGTGSWCPP